MDKKKKKKTNNNFRYINDNFDIDIDFAEIGENIKKSVNNTIKRFTQPVDKENLPQTRNAEVCTQKPPELGKSQLLKAFAILSFFGFGLLAFIMLVEGMALYSGLDNFILFLISILGTFALPAIIWQGSKEYLRLSNNYARFLNELGNNTVISIKDLASAVAQTEEKTVSDLMKMMKRGYFYQARIVEDNSLFLLDIPTFKLYKEKKNELPETPSRSSYSKEDDQYELSAEELSAERAREIINSGKNQIDEIKNNQNRISDAGFRANVDKILENSDAILKIVDKYPEKSYALNKFSDYYLPTTSKLVETYWEFEMMRTDDPKISNSMTEINKSIVTISEAFEKIKVELLADRAMDIKTDIDTINLLLNQEGYTEDDWKLNE